jgi:hypothetical protein
MRTPSNNPTTDLQGLRLEMAKLWRQMRPGRARDFVNNQFVADCRGGWFVESHGGRIWMEPNLDGGTIFRFTVAMITDEQVA